RCEPISSKIEAGQTRLKCPPQGDSMRSFKFTFLVISVALIMVACQPPISVTPTQSPLPPTNPGPAAELNAAPTVTPDPAIPTPGLLAIMATKAAATSQAVQQTEQVSGTVALPQT